MGERQIYCTRKTSTSVSIFELFIPHAAMSEMFNRNAIGVRGSRSTISPTPMA